MQPSVYAGIYTPWLFRRNLLAGLTIRPQVNHLDPTIQKDPSLNAQLNMAGYDTLGACIFAGFGYAATPDAGVKRVLKARHGWDDIPDKALQALGKETIKMDDGAGDP